MSRAVCPIAFGAVIIADCGLVAIVALCGCWHVLCMQHPSLPLHQIHHGLLLLEGMLKLFVEKLQFYCKHESDEDVAVCFASAVKNPGPRNSALEIQTMRFLTQPCWRSDPGPATIYEVCSNFKYRTPGCPDGLAMLLQNSGAVAAELLGGKEMPGSKPMFFFM